MNVVKIKTCFQYRNHDCVYCFCRKVFITAKKFSTLVGISGFFTYLSIPNNDLIRCDQNCIVTALLFIWKQIWKIIKHYQSLSKKNWKTKNRKTTTLFRIASAFARASFNVSCLGSGSRIAKQERIKKRINKDVKWLFFECLTDQKPFSSISGEITSKM
jgi:hypothetical protein